MKNLFIIPSICLCLSVKAQQAWIYVTPKKDTIFLQQDSKIADQTFDIWLQDTAWKGYNPVVIRAPRAYISYRRRTNPIVLNNKKVYYYE